MWKLIIIGALLWIYLGVIKPNQYRNECADEAKLEAVKMINNEVESDENKRQQMQDDYERLKLKECLKVRGLDE